MARIIWDSNNIDVFFGENSLKLKPHAQFNHKKSGAGVIETINQYQIEFYTFDAIYSADTWRKLYAWFYGWASLGKTWAFAMDPDKAVSTTLDGSAAADQKTVPLTSTTDIKVGETLILTPAGREHREAIKVADITDGVSITTVDDLFYAYASGDGCRHHEYFPSVKSIDPDFEYLQDGDNYFSTFNFIEAIQA